MKLLVIGIDGGTKEIIEGMPMPFTQSLFKDSISKNLDEDLISRGWAEALTGEHAASNKAFYLMPCADGSYDFSASYSKSDMVSASTNKTIWKRLNDSNVSVGIVNVPTTGPADDVNGFIIAGGGGGVKATGGVPDGMVYPPKYKGVLEKNNYVFDVRLPGGETTVSGFLKKIGQAERVQKDTFVELSKIENPQFGFHCFRITTEVQYLARYEIDRCIKKISECKERGVNFEPSTELEKNLVNHYKGLDESIKSIFKELNPENYLFIGDHSTALFEHEGNLDVWLSDNGYLNKLSRQEVFIQRAWRFLNFKVLTILGKKLKPKATLVRRPITRFSRRKSQAFGTFYDSGNFAGIFINDKDRFGGPVKSHQSSNELVRKICKDFNADSTAVRFGLEAKPYRALHDGAPYQHLMPDIKIHKPDSIYFSSRRWKFVTENPNLKPLEENLQGIRYPHAGSKGSDPLFVYSKGLEPLIIDGDPNDLRLAYRLISRFFGQAV
jgi:predicted AlkP superfamily phosphohydrolase/phosphomutase